MCIAKRIIAVVISTVIIFSVIIVVIGYKLMNNTAWLEDYQVVKNS